MKPALLGRVAFEHTMINKAPRVINDDIVINHLPGHGIADRLQITFNTQGSAQWDSFRHFAYQAEKKFYNGYASSLLWQLLFLR